MTSPTPHGQAPQALRLAHIFDHPLPPEWPEMVAAAAELRRQHTRIAELEAQIEALSGVRALSAAPANPLTISPLEEQQMFDDWCPYRGNPDPRTVWAAAIEAVNGMQLCAASPTPPAEQQAAPKAAQGVGNSGFDHQTAADFLSGKTVSDEAVRKFVQASRWAHDEKASLSAMLLSVRGELAAREAEIALLKKALLEAEAAPQQEAQVPAPKAAPVTQQAGYAEVIECGNSYAKVKLKGEAFGSARVGDIFYTAPQPAPAQLSEMPYEKRKAIQEGEQISASDAWFHARINMLDTLDRRNVFRAGFDRGWNAAIAAQGGR